MADKKLNIKVRTQGAKKAKKDLKGVEGGMKSLGKAAAAIGVAFFAAKGLISGLRTVIDLSAKQELAEKKLQAALGKTSKTLLSYASSLQKVTMFGDEATIEAMALMAAFTKDENALKKLTSATLDYAAATGTDLNAAAALVGRTFGTSMNAMSRYGVAVEGAAGSTERLESLTGNLAKMFGGQALAQTNTMAGSIQQMENAVGDAQEAIGTLLAPAVIKIAKGFKGAAEAVNEYITQLRLSNTALEGLVDTDERILVLEAKLIEAKKMSVTSERDGIVMKGKVQEKVELIAALEEQIALAKMGNFFELSKEQQAELDRLQQIIDHNNLYKETISAIKPEHEAELEILANIALTEEEILFLKQTHQELSNAEKQLSADYLVVQEKLADKAAEEKEIREKMSQFASQTAISLGTSALMGDNVTESLKRAVIQFGLMVAQAKLLDFFMNASKGFSFGGILGGIGSFLFGASPTQAAPSASVAAGSKIVINNNISGFGTIDSNFASNSLIPAINKAISTGQARIG